MGNFLTDILLDGIKDLIDFPIFDWVLVFTTAGHSIDMVFINGGFIRGNRLYRAGTS